MVVVLILLHIVCGFHRYIYVAIAASLFFLYKIAVLTLNTLLHWRHKKQKESQHKSRCHIMMSLQLYNELVINATDELHTP